MSEERLVAFNWRTDDGSTLSVTESQVRISVLKSPALPLKNNGVESRVEQLRRAFKRFLGGFYAPL